MLLIDQALNLPASGIERDLKYLPLPNRVDFVRSASTAPAGRTKAAFMLPFLSTGELVMACNARRGHEFAGGHVEEGETLLEAAVRETLEETGCLVEDVIPIGFLRMITLGDRPEDYQYPFPVSFQQFFTGRVSKMVEYAANDECEAPVLINEDVALGSLSGNRRATYSAAFETMMIASVT